MIDNHFPQRNQSRDTQEPARPATPRCTVTLRYGRAVAATVTGRMRVPSTPAAVVSARATA
ncbi:hypothetical protein [Streptomyces sp. AK02-01A]|uniref:hypothetical protein n=1 Tax=Streptomyces sp. AK02-01A TaxID=3028648 RepID=UPI0029A07374|nr:hypothetical protein [Streptomyces sp. AK02-01A]MDX3850152.1 hypothetical protein [Streptomyces sp. AK02-01A]